MGQGLPWPAPAMVPWERMFDLPAWTGDEASTAIARHWYLDGLSAPDPIEIPYAWLSGQMRARQDKPITYAAVTKVGGGTAVATAPSSRQVPFTATLQSANDVDAPNLAHFMITYYDEPRTRLSQMRMSLISRTQEEIWTILGARIGDHIHITGHPTRWPDGAAHQVIEGIGHESDGAERIVTWSTAPHVGEDAHEVGPFFRVGVSLLDGPDKLPW